MSDPFAARWSRRHEVDPVLRARGEQRDRDERSRDYVFLVDVVPREGYASFDTVQRYELR